MRFRRAALGALLCTLILGACGGDSGSADNDAGDVTDELAEAVEDAGPCDEQYAEGTPLTEESLDAACTDAEGTTFPLAARRDCADGRELVWHDYGWGYVDDVWHPHQGSDQAPPPEEVEACSGS